MADPREPRSRMSNRPPDQFPEPEIIPPDRPGRRSSSRGNSFVWMTVERDGTRRIHVARPGWFTIAFALLFVSVVVAALIALVLGAFLVLVPAIALLVFGLIAAGMLRNYLGRLRSKYRRRR